MALLRIFQILKYFLAIIKYSAVCQGCVDAIRRIKEIF